MVTDRSRAQQVAEIILDGFNLYFSQFGRLTLGARQHFEEQDWPGAQRDWLARLDLYGEVVAFTLAARRAAVPDAAMVEIGALQRLRRELVREPTVQPLARELRARLDRVHTREG